MLISVVVPTYNEEGNVEIFYHEVSSVLKGLDTEWEIIYVNDGSRDHSAELIMKLLNEDGHVNLLNLSRNFGSYGAISAGMAHARGDAVICMSCDLQDPPSLITEFFNNWRQGADIVWGIRATRNDPGFKAAYANIFYWILRKFIWHDFPQGGMDCGLFDRRIIDLYNNLPLRNTIPFLAIYDMGFRQVQIPYDRRERLRGQSNWPFFKRVKSAIDVLLDFSYLPIRLISTLGILISIFSIMYAVTVILNRIFLGIGGSGWPSTIALVAFLGGIELTVLGVLGEYIWRVAEQARARPRFIIMDRLGFNEEEKKGNGLEMFRPHSQDPMN